MNYFKKYLKIIQEDTAEDRYRKAKGLEPLEDPLTYEQLEKYKDDPNVYISFRSIDKIGINPLSKWNTPNGIYTYPLKEIWSFFRHESKQIHVPFAGENPYIYVIKPKAGAKILDVSSGSYTESDFDKDIEKLKSSGFNVESAIRKYKKQDPGERIWSVTFSLTYNARKQENKSNLWNRILKKTLGYDYALDKGSGIIHENEPTQAVFFDTTSFDTIDVIKNKTSRIKPSATKIWNGGTFTDDIWKTGVWRDGTFEGKEWKDGIWVRGIFKGGIWRNGTWKGGVFKSGTWRNGIWQKGTFENGTWENGKWLGGTFDGGIWKGGTWKGGAWKSGTWKGGWDSNQNWMSYPPPEWKEKHWIREAKTSPDTKYEIDDNTNGLIWKNGTWYSGIWRGGIWKGGYWKSGTWQKGLWERGTWEDGNWIGGVWKGGYDKKGKFHPAGDSPDKWKWKKT